MRPSRAADRCRDGARPARRPRHAGRAGGARRPDRVASIRRRGKFLLIDLDRDAIVVNPMLTGRFQLAAPSDEAPNQDGRRPRLRPAAAATRRQGRAAWTRGAAWLPADDAQPEVRYRDPTQMGKVYLLPGRRRAAGPRAGRARAGPDADDPALTLDVWRDRIRRHPGELKNLLRNQSFVAGIGNAYSDEILHAAGLLPFRKRSSLAAEEIDALYQATRETLADGDRDPARAGPADVREAGARLPRGP